VQIMKKSSLFILLVFKGLLFSNVGLTPLCEILRCVAKLDGIKQHFEITCFVNKDNSHKDIHTSSSKHGVLLKITLSIVTLLKLNIIITNKKKKISFKSHC